MKKIKIIINGLQKSVFQNLNLQEILNIFFDKDSEFLVQKNSQIIKGCFDRVLVKEYDILNVISYSKDKSLNSKRQYRFKN